MNQSIKQINKSNQPMNESTKPNPSEKQRGIGVVELLFTAATIGAAVVIGAMSYTKRPPLQSD